MSKDNQTRELSAFGEAWIEKTYNSLEGATQSNVVRLNTGLPQSSAELIQDLISILEMPEFREEAETIIRNGLSEFACHEIKRIRNQVVRKRVPTAS